jgi:lipopolysaccharide transport system permease protein
MLKKLNFKPSRTVTVDAANLDAIPWTELWRFRELFGLLAWRDFLVRYKQTAIGIFWALLEPLIRMVVLTVVFKEIAGMQEITPVVVFAGVLPWQFFRQSLSASSFCLVNNRAMVSKVYFPRLILPASSIMVNFVDFVINFTILLCLMLAYGEPLTFKLLALLPLVMLAGALALGVSCFMSAMYIKYRDFKLILPFILEIGMLATPVGYRLEDVPEHLRLFYYLNPVTGIVDSCRWAVLDGATLYAPGLALSIAVTALVLMTGLRYFRHAERWFTDLI